MRSQSFPPKLRNLAAIIVLVALAGCGAGTPQPATGEGGRYKLGRPYEINGRWYEPYYDPDYAARGVASWYGEPFHGRSTANGERFDKRRLSAAHTTLPLPSLVEVTNLENGRRLVVRVNDRGPFVGDRIIDLSEAAAHELGFHRDGLADVEVRFLRLADADGVPPRPTARASRTAARATPTVARQAGTGDRPALVRIAAANCELWYVQAGAFREPDRAHAVATMVEGLFDAAVSGHAVREGGLTRVRVGPFTGHDAAHRALAKVVGDGHRDAFLLQVHEGRDRCTA